MTFLGNTARFAAWKNSDAPARCWSEAIQINQYGGLTWKEAMQLDEQDIENQKPHRPCSGLRKELKECLLASDCVKKVNFARSVLSM